jgi:hypothetical protein
MYVCMYVCMYVHIYKYENDDCIEFTFVEVHLSKFTGSTFVCDNDDWQEFTNREVHL